MRGPGRAPLVHLAARAQQRTKVMAELKQRFVSYLSYADAPAALDFLGKAFGFTEKVRYAMPDGRIGHSVLEYHEHVLMLASEYEGFGQSPLNLATVHSQIMCYVDDVD